MGKFRLTKDQAWKPPSIGAREETFLWGIESEVSKTPTGHSSSVGVRASKLAVMFTSLKVFSGVLAMSLPVDLSTSKCRVENVGCDGVLMVWSSILISWSGLADDMAAKRREGVIPI